MRLEYPANGSPDCPLIRLDDFQPSEAAALLAAIGTLAASSSERIEVHRFPFAESVGGCELALTRRLRDFAIVRGSHHNQFERGFTAETWDHVAGLLEPFSQGAGGFQWLAGAPGETALLLSATATGEWYPGSPGAGSAG